MIKLIDTASKRETNFKSIWAAMTFIPRVAWRATIEDDGWVLLGWRGDWIIANNNPDYIIIDED